MARYSYYNLYNFTTYGSLGISQKVLEDITRLILKNIEEVKVFDIDREVSFRKRSVKVDIISNTNEIFIYLNIGVKYGHNISEVSKNVQTHIENALLAMTDIRPKKIFIKVTTVE